MRLQVQNAVFNLFRTTLVPELRTNVAAGSARNIKLALIAIGAAWALPYQLTIGIFDNLDLAIIGALLAVVALRIELGIHDVIVNETHHANDRLQIVLHIGNLDVGDSSARRKALELAFELELLKGVDLLGNMHVIAVSDVAVVGDVWNDTKAALQAASKLVGGRLQGRTVQRVVDILGSLPLFAFVVHALHNGNRKGRCFWIGVRMTGHEARSFVQTCVTKRNGRVAIVKEFIDGLALVEARQGTVLPQNRSSI